MAITSLNTTMRLTGLTSGMDTDSIVKNLMQIEQYKLNKQLRAQTTLQWRQDALKSVSKDMTAFRNTFLTSLPGGMMSSGVYTSYNVSMTGSKKDSVNISATAEAAYMKVVVNKITQLAEGAATPAGQKVSAAGKTELSEGNVVKLGDLDFANDLFVGTKTVQVAKQVQVEGEHGLLFTTQDNSLVYKNSSGVFTDYSGTVLATQPNEADLKAVMTTATQPKTNAAGQAMFHDESGNIYYQSTSNPDEYFDRDGVIADVTGKTLTAVSEIVYEDKEVADDTIKFAINGVDFEFTKDTTLAQMFSAVNNSKAGVTMTYSRLTDSFSITTRETGAQTSLTIENQRGNAFGANGAFGIAEYGAPQRDADGEIIKDADGNAMPRTDIAGALAGKNAVVYINGTRVERSANSFTIDGIRYTLNYETGTETDAEKANGKIDANNIDPEIAVTANFTKNIDSAVDSIKKFVEGYNTMINKLYSLVHEKKNSKYYALTDEEKSAMTESQVKEWEELAKSGLLRNDRDIQNVISNMRSAFYTTVEAAGLSAQDIGLRTAYASMSGEITLNETDLRAALERDSDAVMRVFMGNPSSNEPEAAGLITRLDTILKTYTGTTQFDTLTSMDRDMKKLVDKISDMEDRMAVLEEKYYLKYAAMETALSKMQSQTNWISSMLGTSS